MKIKKNPKITYFLVIVPTKLWKKYRLTVPRDKTINQDLNHMIRERVGSEKNG